MSTAADLVQLSVDNGGLSNDALLAAVLPLLEQTAEIHDRGLVAPLRGIGRLTLDDQSRLGFPPELAARPVEAPKELTKRETRRSKAVDVVGHQRLETDFGTEGAALRVQVAEPRAEDITAPVLVPGWQSWEHVVGHHDPLTDIFSLGQLLIGLGCGLDLGRTEDVARLIVARGNLHALNPELHPVIASVAVQMADPERHRRAQDLRSLVTQLENYRDQPVDFDVETVTAAAADRRTAVLTALRDRLFDLSRRNRLINFRYTAQTLNLTEASVPLMLDVRNIKPEHLFTWNDSLAKRVLSGSAHPLGRWLRYDEAPYTTNSLDALISTARRDRAEYGQDQLRLVPAFLRWHDLKNDPGTRLSSPLLLVKVELAKKRGVRDSYALKVTDTVAEVNPALRQHLLQLYGISLPSHVDLASPDAIGELHSTLQKEIARTEPGLTLHLRERPRIDLVRHRALLRLRNYRRRQHGNRAGEFGRRHYAYSYRRTDYQPLGVQIFRTQLCHTPLPVGVYLGEDVRGATLLDTDLYTLDSGQDGSPYSWDVDLCAVTLANFNYRTLGLVRDYDELLTTSRSCASFDQLFSDSPRPLVTDAADLPLADRHLVVPADGSQVAAIARARHGDSLVIQGPPGTGKSQTITNMIADFVARGLRVLFVCQKRAALDVVHSRLAGRHLDELCTLIHDTQADKKAFVHGLRDTYEAWLTAGDDLEALSVRRTAAIARVESLLATVSDFESRLGSSEPSVPSVRDVVTRLVELRSHQWGGDLAPEQRRLLPEPTIWWQGRHAAAAVAGAVQGSFADSPFSSVIDEVWLMPAADAEIPARAAVARDAWENVARSIEAVAAEHPAGGALLGETVERLRSLAGLAAVVAPFAERGRSAVLDPSSPGARFLRQEIARQQALVRDAAAATEAAAGWREPLPEADARSALTVAQGKEGKLFSFLSKDWRAVKALVGQRYDASARAVRPKVTEVLAALVGSYDAGRAVRDDAARTAAEWGHEDLQDVGRRLAAYAESPDPLIAGWRTALAAQPDPGLARLLSRLGTALRTADEASASLLVDVSARPLGAVRELTGSLAAPQHAAAIRTLAPAMRLLAQVPGEVQVAVRGLPAGPEQIEYAVCAAYWDRLRAAAPVLGELTSDRLDGIVTELADATAELTDLDAAVVVAGVRARFLTELAHSELSVTGMTDEDRARKKTFSAGRRELEHEFGKVMRYKSIRELSSGDSGTVVSLLRPVWLMSPSSVSDTLPLDPQHNAGFDVVIYDEASQIPVEEAIPAMHRAPQVIVVGDKMQLPPTQYFQVAQRSPDEDELDDDEQIGVVLNEDSFLSISALRLASTMLSWHYRSRSEALISFCNSAFYGGRLATVPDRLPPRPALPRTSREDLGTITDAVLTGSITAVRVQDGVYERRTNPGEAAWIASLVRELLARETGDSIGIVAFSEAQQGEIERALEGLAQADPDFGALYESELTRTLDGQDVGLFVKNLENVQGDERDIVILSICYAPGPDGRMLMNFGPINTAGGEKRLNVIFSRARKHMVVVSSIQPDAITNTYNDGANTLRRFLGYAEAVSRGDTEAVRAALAPYTTMRKPVAAMRPEAVVEQLAEALRHRGVEVQRDVGESAFRCDLALRRPGSPGYSVAVLVDTPARLASDSAYERLTTHHRALSDGGWTVANVLTTEWIHDPAAVTARLVTLLDHSAVRRPQSSG